MVGKSKSVEKEIEILYEMVDSTRFTAIEWSKSGRCIVIRNPGMFRFITGPFFGFCTGIEEFKRLLESYGFKKIGRSGLKYYNKFFQRQKKNFLGMIYKVNHKSDREIPKEEIDSMNENIRIMMSEVPQMIGRLRENEKKISKLRDSLFSLCSHMKTLKPYHEFKSINYDPSNKIEFEESMLEWAKRYFQDNANCSFGFLDEVGDLEVPKVPQKSPPKKKEKEKVKKTSGITVNLKVKRHKFNDIVQDFQ
ncbi:heat shock transcription factor-like protein [Encephalitozoon intestinalis ATCC 50506]|uniref:Heat shock transcription factor-like protein n=1 Tax=Encephalitozoon intestinalis (strain ATCC 50506) TaxID=876142 RepID=E0S6K2_ENCIT|nr:heat shock transcription factor-like protein [Encephalitozoon intestinalis ATCC 50506]ADM11337.1 heat shock transcription factor-like protein [Encephalitozoon intestinalis ATCC 50506]UTX45025.1 hypothetical protein GPK93_04g05610 [Encephalitozoon intestinalis]